MTLREHPFGVNRTFMELKLRVIGKGNKERIRVNRTFMELKLQTVQDSTRQYKG